jgi:phosphohistidine phosphatase SixA
MKVYLVHHTNALKAEQDPERHLSRQGREEADRLGARFKAAGAAPVRILHSDKQWTRETAERIAAAMGAKDTTALAGYPVNTGHPIEPFMQEIKDSQGDIMMAGHVDYLLRSASRLLCGDENRHVVEFKPGNGTAFCLEGDGDDWAVAFGWRQDHTAG